ncbi:MAG: MBL fold metallo-hydrolase, partial [Chthoniobacterales bacterium]
IPLEDTFADVLGKAMKGLSLGEAEAAAKSGVAEETLRSLLRGQYDESSVRQLSACLGLRADALAKIGRGEYVPTTPEATNLVQVTTNYGGMTVNAYVLWDRENRGAAIFDTGADAAPDLGQSIGAQSETCGQLAHTALVVLSAQQRPECFLRDSRFRGGLRLAE